MNVVGVHVVFYAYALCMNGLPINYASQAYMHKLCEQDLTCLRKFACHNTHTFKFCWEMKLQSSFGHHGNTRRKAGKVLASLSQNCEFGNRYVQYKCTQ